MKGGCGLRRLVFFSTLATRYDAFRRRQWGVGALLAGLSLLWYSGTIYGAVDGAHRYNRDARLNFLEELDRGAGLDIAFPDPAAVGAMLRVSGPLPGS